jgi:broad specificity phosphatase PhoE
VTVLRYISHPDVVQDPQVPVPRWGLSELGVARARAMTSQPWVATIGRVVSSPETKALEAAAILADHLGLEVEVRDATGEIDRSSTGFLPADEHEVNSHALFAAPEESARGWERAVDAQGRIDRELADLLVPGDADVAVVGHGAVGTLWYCHMTGQPIDRRHDQPGQGHYFTIDLDTREVLHHWRAIDAF